MGEKLLVAGERIAAAARERVPVQTGRLRDSIRVELDIEGGRIAAHIIAGGPDTFYAQFVEFGTEYMDAESFLRTGAEAAGYHVTEGGARG